jgi:hypothetical protein
MAAKLKKTDPTKKPAYGQPEKSNLKALVLGWGFVVLGIGVIIWLAMIAAPEKKLTCNRPGGHSASLIEFGTCTDE